ncbi:L,D-transpeptidase [Brucella pseudogrignonensis]|uniref:L,D-transpeptidase n=1 Tax=Brucella pseudogrignonensis TaxID=419475 RepID=UPI003D99FCBF
MHRRCFIISLPAFLAGCVSQTNSPPRKAEMSVANEYIKMYAPINYERFPIPAPNLLKIDKRFYRQEVDYVTDEKTGTIVVDTKSRHLYLVGENRRALRYGIGVGKAGLEFQGVGVVQYKRQWPSWRPTNDMIAREPERYGPLRDGMGPGLTNPLGARALYLFKDGHDTLFRIHGTSEDWSIGRAISSGCIRLLHHDIIDLYDRIPDRARVVVLQ